VKPDTAPGFARHGMTAVFSLLFSDSHPARTGMCQELLTMTFSENLSRKPVFSRVLRAVPAAFPCGGAKRKVRRAQRAGRPGASFAVDDTPLRQPQDRKGFGERKESHATCSEPSLFLVS